MTKHLVASTLALFFTMQVATAADDAGSYNINSISLDGASWTDATTSVTAGQTYAIVVGLDYTASDSDAASYSASQNLSLNLGDASGALLGSASASTPSSTTIDSFLGVSWVGTANWLLEGSLTFNESFGAPGVYNVAFSSEQYSTDSFSQALNVQAAPALSNPVPAPGTLASMALGLLGLTFLRRRISRR